MSNAVVDMQLATLREEVDGHCEQGLGTRREAKARVGGGDDRRGDGGVVKLPGRVAANVADAAVENDLPAVPHTHRQGGMQAELVVAQHRGPNLVHGAWV